jgi:hypothetical protein
MRAPIVLISMLAAMALVPAAAEARAPKKPLPDLQVSRVSYTPKAYAFKAEPASQFRFCERTKNIGKVRTPRRLHSVMKLEGPGPFGGVVARRNVPRLRPGESHYGCARGEPDALDLPPGGYRVLVCSDLRLRDRSRANNCRGCTEAKCFFVLKRSWTATVNGTGSFGILEPIAESWQTNAGTTFKFAEQIEPGHFKYTMTGSVSYTDAGSGNGCEHHGSGTDVSPDARLQLDYGRDTYLASGRTSTGFSYAITNSCSETDHGPGNPLFLNTGIGTGPQPLPFGSEELSGTYAPDEDSHIFWIFR